MTDAERTLARALEQHRAGHLAEAERLYRDALRLNPELPEAHYNLGTVLHALGRLAEAESCYAAAARLRPGFAEAHYNLAVLFLERRNFARAAAAAAGAIAARPDSAAAHNALGLARLELGETAAAFVSLRDAVRLAPGESRFRSDWAACIAEHGIPESGFDGQIADDLLRVLDLPEVLPRSFVGPVFAVLRRDKGFARVLEQARGLPYSAAAGELARLPLCLRILELAAVSEPDVEDMLTALRAALIVATDSGETSGAGLRFSAALAAQCFVNEYVFDVTPPEAAAADRLGEEVARRLQAGGEVPPAWIAALGAYRPLHGLGWAPALRTRVWPAEIAAVIRMQIEETLQEQALRAGIPRLTPLSDAVSQSVRRQYEENPYPRWIKPVRRAEPQTLSQELGSLFPQAALGALPQRPEILVAGCGTGLNAIYTASRFADARVLAVDLSLPSLAYAIRKTRELGIANIDYGQADLLGLGALGRRFDVVDCIGVLHHLRDPLAGWRVLAGVLRPGGVMRIGLYSELGRRGVVKARAMIAAKGYSAEPEDMRRCRRDIRTASPASEPEIAGLVNADIYNMSELRDLLFHVEEHRFSLPQIAEALRELGLEFLGFDLPDEAMLRRFRRDHPDARALSSLEAWDRFERANPDAFAGMYQFWCRTEGRAS